MWLRLASEFVLTLISVQLLIVAGLVPTASHRPVSSLFLAIPQIVPAFWL